MYRFSSVSAAVAVAGLALGSAGALTPSSAAPAQAQSQAHPAATHATGWVATATRGLTFNGTRLGAAPASTPLHLQMVLTPRHRAAIDAAVKSMYTPGSATYRHFLTPTQYAARYAPTAAAASKVADYLRDQGLTDVHIAGNRMLISARTTAAVAQRAFHTHITSYRTKRGVMFANRTAASVPAALGAVVSSVSGLNDYRVHTASHTSSRTSSRAATPSALTLPSTAGFFPADFRTTYDATGTATGSGTSIAVLTQGDISQVVPDLRTAEKAEGATQVPVSTVQVGAPTTDAAGLDEWDMDTQASTIMATDVKQLLLYNVPTLSTADIMSGINQWVTDDRAPAMSASLGGCEFLTALTGDEAATDAITEEGALQGQTLFASSGDAGAACSLVINTGLPVGVPQVEWPAAGTYTTAVGGTSLLADAQGNRIAEPAWISGGGGTSEFETAGPWTAATDPLGVTGLRAVPDVALDADPETAPVKVYVDGAISEIGGTSLSSPLMLGVWARLESAHGNGLGLASPALYGVYTAVNPSQLALPKAVPGFFDVTLGFNGLYAATPGYDYTTGLGAPDVAQLVAALH